MRNQRKNFNLLMMIAMILTFTLLFAGCWDDIFNWDDNSNNTSQTIELTMDNYQYYLSIDSVCTNTIHTSAIGTVSTIKVTISGAVSGLYKDCTIYYTLGETEYEVKLNAAGFATFNYTVSANSGSFRYSGITGQIII